MNRSAQGRISWILTATFVAALVTAAAMLALRYLRPGVTVTEAVEAPVVSAFYSTGTVLPEREYSIRTPVAGTISVKVDKGDAVKLGDVIAVVTDPSLQYNLDKAEAELRQAKQMADPKTSPALGDLAARLSANQDMLATATRERDHQQALLSQKATSQTDVDRAEDRVKSLWSDTESLKEQARAQAISLLKDVEVAQAALDTAQWEFDQQTIKSPVDGVVLDRPIPSGSRAAINDHLMQIADVRPEKIVMRAQVDEEDRNKLRADQTVKMTLYAFPGEIFTGRVDKIYDKADPVRRTYEVDVRLPKPDPRFAAGMTGELDFIIAAKDKALVIPSQAAQGGYAWVVRDGRVYKTAITVGLTSVERVEITSGLTAGDRIVISPVQGLADGQAVRTTYTDPAIAAAINKPKEESSSFKGFQ